MPVHQSHMLHLAEIDKEIYNKRVKNREYFNIDDFQTPAERMEELKRIHEKHNMDKDFFEATHRHSVDALYRNFISNVTDPYLQLKAAGGNEKKTLIRARFLENPDQKMCRETKERFER